MKKSISCTIIVLFLISTSFSIISCGKKSEPEKVDITFENVSVHDPSILKADDMFYITGSHMASAKSTDLINWTSMSDSVNNTKLFTNIRQELSEALKWGRTGTFWASDWIKLSDGKYYLYYCVCEGSSPQGAIGYAVADNPEGPYTNLGLLIKSSGKEPLEYKEANGEVKTYNAAIHPNAIDPAVFFDAEGKLWMTYGSYSGGIFILELDPKTGKPLDGQGTYGKKLLGENHSEIEASYVTYSPKTKYYYMFLSFGGLTADAGYNMRVVRSEKPDGPYYDSMGQNMIDCKGANGKFLAAQNDIITQYGVKIFGNFNYPIGDLSVDPIDQGYVSPGHNSVYYDKDTEQYFLIFHARFPNGGEAHQVRVHQMFLNDDGWFVVSPFRYSGETIGEYSKKEVVGEYSFINHGHDITSDIKEFVDIKLGSNGKITGSVDGKWELQDGNKVNIIIDDLEYKGVFSNQYDINRKIYTMTFSVIGEKNGTALWGIKK